MSHAEHEMSPEAALVRLKELTPNGPDDALSRDQESEHVEGDRVLCAVLRHLGHAEIADAFEKARENWW